MGEVKQLHQDRDPISERLIEKLGDVVDEHLDQHDVSYVQLIGIFEVLKLIAWESWREEDES